MSLGKMREGNIRRMLVGCNTVDGYRSFAGENLRGLDRVFMLVGAAGCGKSGIIARVAAGMAERGLTVELWQVADEPGAPEGVVIPELSAAVVDVGFMQHISPESPGVVEEIYNLGDCWHQERLCDQRLEIMELQARVRENLLTSAGALTLLAKNQARRYAIAGEKLTDSELDDIAAGLAEEIFSAKRAQVRKFFAAAYTADGWCCPAQELSAACERRILLGNGAGAVLARLADVAVARGLAVDLYYDVLRDVSQPQGLQMVILPQLSVAVADADTPGLQPLWQDELYGEFAEEADAAAGCEPAKLASIKMLLRRCAEEKRRLAAKYTAAMDFDRVDAICAEILAKLWQMAGERGL